jgi:PIN domain nuclease of toxin-antitoxin system
MLIVGSDELLFSAASVAEISTKFARRKLSLPEPPIDLIPKVMADLRLLPLSVTLEHALTLSQLPVHHADPFDRLLIAQATHEQIPIVTGDKEFRRYDVQVVW